MATIIDACGRSCPEPVLMTRSALASKEERYEVLVDNRAAVQNVTRFAGQVGYVTQTTEADGVYRLLLQRK